MARQLLTWVHYAMRDDQVRHPCHRSAHGLVSRPGRGQRVIAGSWPRLTVDGRLV